MEEFFFATIREVANECFRRRCAVSSQQSWSVWDHCYQWVDHAGKLHEGDTIAFVERLGRCPYPALVIGTVARVVRNRCDLAIISHEDPFGPEPGLIVTRPLHALLKGGLKRWPRQPDNPQSVSLPYFVPPQRRDR